MFETYEDMVTIDDVCQMLNIGKNNAYRLLKEGKLHAFKIGRIWKISRQSVTTNHLHVRFTPQKIKSVEQPGICLTVPH